MPPNNSASRDSLGASDSGCVGFGWQLRRWSSTPLLVTAMAPAAGLIPLVSGTSLVFLALLGGLAANAGGAGVTMGAIRVTFWGALAMALTAGVGSLFGTVA
jgi:VIT1/CCC1 family predicted Fe2+/Mn2+ transporter